MTTIIFVERNCGFVVTKLVKLSDEFVIDFEKFHLVDRIFHINLILNFFETVGSQTTLFNPI